MQRFSSVGLITLSVMVLWFTAGCAQTITQAETKALETRELDLSYDDAYKAATNGLFSLGYTVDHSDKTSGLLTGKRKDPQTGAKIASTIAFGIIGLLATGDRDEAVTFMLTSMEPKLTQLRMKVLVNGQQVTDRQIMTKVWQQIEREALLESRPSDRSSSTAPATAPAPVKAAAAPGIDKQS